MKKTILTKMVMLAGLVLLGMTSHAQVIYNNQISNNISGIQSFTQDIIVGYKTELIITGTVKMDVGTKIQVQIGGRLVIDGGTLTTNDPNNVLWQGVEVHGHGQYTDHPAGWGLAYIGSYGGLNATSYQDAGVVVLKNNATIERAETAVHAGSTWQGKEGGIVISLNSTIKNCQDGVVLDKYLTEPNKSYFKNTTFLSQQTQILVAGPTPMTSDWYANSFITLNQVIDVPILGCTFDYQFGTVAALDCSGPLSTKPCFGPDDGYCIIANDATFLVDDYYSGVLNPTLVNSSTFWRAKKAIVVKDLCLNSYRPIIRNSRFENCFESIIVKGTNNIQIHHNEIITWHDAIDGDERPIGIYMEGSTGYNVENNKIWGSTPTFINDPSKITKGVLVTNSGADGDFIYKNTFSELYHGGHAQNDNRGLEFDCNINRESRFSTAPTLIEPYVNFVATSDGTPLSGLANQGSTNRPVYNLFEHYCSGNFNGFQFGDFYIDNIPSLDYNYELNSISFEPLCENITKKPYSSTSEAGFSCPDKLLPGGTRPYVVADVLPPLRARYIDVVQGPQSPPYTDDEIDDAKHMFVRAMNEYIGTFLDSGDATGAIAYLQTEPFDFARRKMVPLQIQVGDFSGATATMNMLDVNEIENAMFKDYYTIVSEVYSTDTLFDDLTAAQLATLEDVANSPTRVSTQAQNWLEIFYDDAYPLIKHPVLFSQGGNERRGSSSNGEAANQSLNDAADLTVAEQMAISQGVISFYPNPSRDVINFDKNEIGTVTIKDLNGKLILSEEVSNGTLSIKGIRSGVYYIEYNEQTPQRLLITN